MPPSGKSTIALVKGPATAPPLRPAEGEAGQPPHPSTAHLVSADEEELNRLLGEAEEAERRANAQGQITPLPPSPAPPAAVATLAPPTRDNTGTLIQQLALRTDELEAEKARVLQLEKLAMEAADKAIGLEEQLASLEASKQKALKELQAQLSDSTIRCDELAKQLEQIERDRKADALRLQERPEAGTSPDSGIWSWADGTVLHRALRDADADVTAQRAIALDARQRMEHAEELRAAAEVAMAELRQEVNAAAGEAKQAEDRYRSFLEDNAKALLGMPVEVAGPPESSLTNETSMVPLAPSGGSRVSTPRGPAEGGNVFAGARSLMRNQGGAPAPAVALGGSDGDFASAESDGANATEAAAAAAAAASAREAGLSAREAALQARERDLAAREAEAARAARERTESHTQRQATPLNAPSPDYSRRGGDVRPIPLDPAIAARLERALRDQVAPSSAIAAKASHASRQEVAALTSQLPHAALPSLDAIESAKAGGAGHRADGQGGDAMARPFESTFLAQYVEQSAQRKKRREKREAGGRARAESRDGLSGLAAKAASAWAGGEDGASRPQTQMRTAGGGGKLPSVPQRGHTSEGLPAPPAPPRDLSPWRGSPVGAGLPAGPPGTMLVPRPPTSRNIKELYPRGYTAQSARARWAQRPESPTSPPLFRSVHDVTDATRSAALPRKIEPLPDDTGATAARSSSTGFASQSVKRHLSKSQQPIARNHTGFMAGSSLSAR